MKSHSQRSDVALEICCSSVESAMLAQSYGADRVELCQNLDCGGLTPSYGLIKSVVQSVTIPVHVLIRPCVGPTTFTSAQMQVMIHDIEMCKSLNVSGVVIGAITEDGRIDRETTSRLIAAAGNLHVTFHRGFDDCLYSSKTEIAEALQTLVALGCSRLLTSGLAPNAAEGIENINFMVEWTSKQGGSSLEIMAGAGVKSRNVAQIITSTGVRAVHMSAKSLQRPPVTSRGLFGSAEALIDTDDLKESVDSIRKASF